MKKISIIIAIITILLVGLSFVQGLKGFDLEDYFAWFSFSESQLVAEIEPEDDSPGGEYILPGVESEIEKIVVTGSKMPSEVSPIVKFWVKFGFSVVFGVCALFVILSKKYNEETQKWAFGILSLVSGVWIGTVT